MMNSIKTLRLFAVSALLLSACDSGQERLELAACSDSIPCEDASTVCVNQYCIPKCSPQSCRQGQICSEAGVCTPVQTVDPQPECSDSIPCPNGKECTNGVCTPAQTVDPKPECSDENPCQNDQICADSKCVECISDDTCSTGRICSNGACVIDPEYQTGSCNSSQDCESGLICADNVCKPECSNSSECGTNRVCDQNICVDACIAGSCGDGMVCEGTIRICVPGECSWYDSCPAGQVCDMAKHQCFERCTQGSCESGTVCAEDGLCVPGECSKIDNICADSSKACDYENMKCMDKCSTNDDCESGMLCDRDGSCVTPCKADSCIEGKVCMPDGLCIPGECSVIDHCSLSYKVCVDHQCIDKCNADQNCGNNQICDKKSGICMDKCTPESCESGTVCAESGLCVTGECSEYTPCANGRVCSATYTCVDPVVPANECYFYKDCGNCDDILETCANECSFAEDNLNDQLGRCQTAREQCTNDYTTCENIKKRCDDDAKETFDKLQNDCVGVDACYTVFQENQTAEQNCVSQKNDCTDDAENCENTYQSCMSEVKNTFDAQLETCKTTRCFAKLNTCENNRTKCELLNKRCPEGKQCNAHNECIDSATADGLGLGAMCNDGNGNIQSCASDLICSKNSSDKASYCIPAVYAQDRKPCTVGAFQDKCEGNIIVECNETTGSIMVQDCKTDYTDFSVPTTGIFHGDNFVCAKVPGTRYVTCAEQCETLRAEKFICGWDADDYDIDYSDRYACQYNQDGISAYFPVSSQVCSSTCEYETGLCDE